MWRLSTGPQDDAGTVLLAAIASLGPRSQIMHDPNKLQQRRMWIDPFWEKRFNCSHPTLHMNSEMDNPA